MCNIVTRYGRNLDVRERYMKKKYFLLTLVLVLVFSLMGCSNLLEQLDYVTGSKLTEEEIDVLDTLEKCMKDIDEELEGDPVDKDELKKAIDKTARALKRIDKDETSEYMDNLIDEMTIYLDELWIVMEVAFRADQFAEDFNEINNSEVTTNMQDFSDMKDVENAYYTVCNQADMFSQMECPQYCETVVNRLAGLYGSYATLLENFYYAVDNGDYLSAQSDYCYFYEVLSELEYYETELEEQKTELMNHLEKSTEKVTAMNDEIFDNIEYLEDEEFSKVQFSYLDHTGKMVSTIECIDTIYPAMYNSLDAVSILTLSYTQGECDVLVSVEVEEYSQKYEKTLTLGVEPQRLYIKPPVLSTGLSLDNQKESQIKVSITEVSTGKVLASETKTVRIMSVNDFVLNNDEYGYTNRADILAWVTPESQLIQEVLRYGAEYMGEYIGVESIAAYQQVTNKLDAGGLTALQVYAIQKVISDVGVRYVQSAYSIGDTQNVMQRVNRPEQTLESKSGICVETSVLLASALQAAGFDTMLVLTTNHCQVAVETWRDSGEYYLIETTVLPIGEVDEMYGDTTYLEAVICCPTNEEWDEYLTQNDGYVYSCNMASTLGITPLNY